MNYMNQLTSGIGQAVTPSPPSEIERESSELENAIQSTFEASQELSKRLQPVLSQYPSPPQDQNKNPEEALSGLGGKIRISRRSIQAIDATIREILQRLAI